MKDGTQRKQSEGKSSILVWFLIFSLIVSVSSWFAMDMANKRLETTHEVILSHQKAADKLSGELVRKYALIMSDSSANKKEKALRDFEDYLSNIVNTMDLSGSNERICNLLEAEFSKIQSEYEILNLWCALLTVVFLIFSFFSIFKANEMANQSENALSNMRHLSHEVHSKSEEIDKDILLANKKIGRIFNAISSITNNKAKLAEKITNLENNNFKTLENKVNTIEKKTADIDKRLDLSYNTRIDTFNDFVEGKRTYLEREVKEMVEAESKLVNEDLAVQIKELHNRYATIKKMLEESSKERQELANSDVEEIEDCSIIDSEEGKIDSDEDHHEHGRDMNQAEDL